MPIPARKESNLPKVKNKFFAHVACFAELVKTGLWDIWSEQIAPYTWLMPIPARKESYVGNQKNKLFSNFSCIFLNPNYFLQIWILNVLIY